MTVIVISNVIQNKMEMEIKTVIKTLIDDCDRDLDLVIGNRMEMEMEIMIEIVGVIVITGNHLMDNLVHRDTQFINNKNVAASWLNCVIIYKE